MTLQKRLVDQFHNPHGLVGHLAGRIMATRQSNLDRNRWTVDLLDLEPDDRVLELGPGPGVTLGLILDQVPNGHVVGLDHSPTMLSQCAKRNRKALEQKRLSLLEGEFTRLPELAGPFDKILAVNALQFDGMQAATISRIAHHLAADGTFAVTFQPRGSNPTDEKALAFASRVADLFAEAGLPVTRIETLPLEPVCAVCVLARR
jgi:cyclopropane fatty-acyl-phospholipid synthase-like methyltransferase